MSIQEFIQFFLSICGGVSIIGGAVAVIFKWITPAFRLNKRVGILEDHDKRDFEALKRIAERFPYPGGLVNHAGQSDQRRQCRGIKKKQNRSLQIILHRISVNCINKRYAHEIICVHKERYRQVFDRV